MLAQFKQTAGLGFSLGCNVVRRPSFSGERLTIPSVKGSLLTKVL